LITVRRPAIGIAVGRPPSISSSWRAAIPAEARGGSICGTASDELFGANGAYPVSMVPPVCYLQRDGVSIAYQVVGDEPVDLLFIPGAISHLALEWESPYWRRWCDRIVSFARLIRLDKRGTGLSDRPGGPYSSEERMEDARAVLDAVGVQRAHVLGTSEGGPLAILLAVSYPERVQSLVLCGTQACFHRAPGTLLVCRTIAVARRRSRRHQHSRPQGPGRCQVCLLAARSRPA